MPSFSSKTVLKKTFADRVAVPYSPTTIPQTMAEPARSFVAATADPKNISGFRLNSLIADKTGISQHEKNATLEAIEKSALEKLKEIEERAYQEAHALGLEEGKNQAHAAFEAELRENLDKFGKLLASIENLKQEMITFNETHIVKLAFYLAEKIAMKQINENSDSILPILKATLESSLNDEQITLKISARDHEFIQSTQERLGKEFDFLKRTKFDISESIQPGGCIIETNYGVVDATLPERLSKLAETLSGLTAKVKDQVG